MKWGYWILGLLIGVAFYSIFGVWLLIIGAALVLAFGRTR